MVLGLLILWSLVVTICAVAGFALILSSLMTIPIWAAAIGGSIFFLLIIPIVAFVERGCN